MLDVDESAVARLLYWIQERESIRLLKQSDQPKPWTDDPILQSYRFCNVQREDDKVTRWIAHNWRDPNCGERHLWFAMVVARYLNEPHTLNLLGYPVPWTPTKAARLRKVQDMLWGDNKPVFNNAYIISTGGQRVNKIEYLIGFFDHLWSIRKRLALTDGWGLLRDYYDALKLNKGIGSFMAAQIVADLKYAHPLRLASDWEIFAAPGPGSKRGLNLIYGRAMNEHWNEADWHCHLLKLRGHIELDLMRIQSLDGRLHAQDLQNCLCEFSKYEKVRLGTGRPKTKYPGAE